MRRERETRQLLASDSQFFSVTIMATVRDRKKEKANNEREEEEEEKKKHRYSSQVRRILSTFAFFFSLFSFFSWSRLSFLTHHPLVYQIFRGEKETDISLGERERRLFNLQDVSSGCDVLRVVGKCATVNDLFAFFR